MPRYYFHVSDGERIFTDAEGVEASGLGGLRREAVRQVREIKAAQLESGVHGRWADWTVTAVDGRGRAVLRMGFDLTPRPLEGYDRETEAPAHRARRFQRSPR